ncbi:MAG: squalene/phytoene synthase family protein [Rhodospirillaceae bacterium]|nr:squalene/phytoene synthase family protein [Rhodospirillaceae bacterium]
MSTAGEIATPSGKNASTENFPVGSALIRADLRPHVHAFYRFARMGDDIADNPTLSPDEKVARLDMMQAALLDPVREDIPAASDLRRSLATTHVAPINSTELLVAFRMDATKQRYASWDELMTLPLFGSAGRPPVAGPPRRTGCSARSSDALCAALQVINHLQDCGVDYLEMDRVYVPQDYLSAAGADTRHLSGKAASAGLRKCLNELLDRTEVLMIEARRLPGQLKDFRLRAESATIVRLADKMIAQLRRHDPLAERVKPTKLFFATALIEGVLWSLVAKKR